VLAVGADRFQAGAAAGTEAEGGVDFGFALRAVGGARLAQNEVEDDAQAVGDEDGDERPKQAAHVAPARVLIDVADQHGVAAKQRSHDDSEQASNGEWRSVAIHADGDHEENRDRQEDRGEQVVGPGREDADLVFTFTFIFIPILGSRGSLICDCHSKSPDTVMRFD